MHELMRCIPSSCKATRPKLKKKIDTLFKAAAICQKEDGPEIKRIVAAEYGGPGLSQAQLLRHRAFSGDLEALAYLLVISNDHDLLDFFLAGPSRHKGLFLGNMATGERVLDKLVTELLVPGKHSLLSMAAAASVPP